MANDSNIARENFERYAYARDNGHIKFTTKANLCRQYIYGNQWLEEDLARLRAARRPALTINKVFSTLVTVEGEALLNRADVAFVPSASGNPQTAEALSKVWLHVAYANKFQWLEDEVSESGFITSRGFYDIRMAFDDNMRGEIRIGRLNANNVVLCPEASEYDPATWPEVTKTVWMEPRKIALLYPEVDVKSLEGRSESSYEVGYDSVDSMVYTFGGGMVRGESGNAHKRTMIRVIERQHKEISFKEHFVNPEAGDMRIIPSNWDRNRIARVKAEYGLEIIKRKVENIRWTVSADDLLLFDEPMPYPTFTIVPYFPFLIDGQSIGLIENLLQPQDLLNKATSQELHIINTTANSGWQMEENQLVNMDEDELAARGAETGLVLVRRANTNPLEKIAPNTVPTGIDRIGFKADEFLKELSGVSDSQRGFDRADVAAKAILAKKQAGAINLSKPLSNATRTRHLVANNVLGLVQIFLTEERTFAITNPSRNPNAQQETVTVNQTLDTGEVVNDLTLGEYHARVTDVPLRDSFEESQFDHAVQLKELGVAIPDHVLIRASRLMHKEEVAAEVRAATGADGPSEQQARSAALDDQLKEIEIQEKAAAVAERQAIAALKTAQAQSEAAKSQGGGAAQIEAAKVAADVELEKMKLVNELTLKREQIQGELTLAREKMQGELAIKQEAARQDGLIKRAEAQERLDTERQAVQNADELEGNEVESLFDDEEL